MRRFRKTTWALLIWSVLCGVVTVAWLAADTTGTAQLEIGRNVAVDDTFTVTLLSTNPVSVGIANVSTVDTYFDYSNITMTDSVGVEHEPTFASGPGDTVPAGGSLTKELDFGNLGGARPVSWHWECDACEVGEAIGKLLVFVLMGGVYWFGMLVLFIMWLVTRPPRVVQIVVESPPATPPARTDG